MMRIGVDSESVQRWADEDTSGSSLYHGQFRYVPYRKRTGQFAYMCFGFAVFLAGMGAMFLTPAEYPGLDPYIGVSCLVQAVFMIPVGVMFWRLSHVLSSGRANAALAAVLVSVFASALCMAVMFVVFPDGSKEMCLFGLFGLVFPLLSWMSVRKWIVDDSVDSSK
ncbi:hypothetical protein OZX74_06715 [Bifidobacterium sp. ESL0798]|uniref:hypothetical protein n=1 Tax=Bifidobacterium sp. ESL0798 TaxID=2983235 RepID=UPI0023F83E88|nr:hypothetical protein [Bifidobacterium sp. ESL0798]WEV73603.1 hypothetical protein OZX74_06715 [Bifidobacterium sp. ESL0798]